MSKKGKRVPILLHYLFYINTQDVSLAQHHNRTVTPNPDHTTSTSVTKKQRKITQGNSSTA